MISLNWGGAPMPENQKLTLDAPEDSKYGKVNDYEQTPSLFNR